MGDNAIGPQELMKLLGEIDISPTSVDALVLAYYCHSSSPGILYEEEFLDGMRSLGVSSLDDLKKRVKTFPIEAKQKNRLLYDFTFGYLVPSNSKVLPIDDALMGIKLTLQGERHVDSFLKFAKEAELKVRTSSLSFPCSVPFSSLTLFFLFHYQ